MSDQFYNGGQPAPFSQEAEEAVLGALLTNPNVYFNVASFLKSDDFFLLRHQWIWQAIERITERNEEYDYLTVGKELHDTGHIEEIGGIAYLLQLVNNTPSSAMAEVYGKLVQRAATRRRLLTAAEEIKELALDEELSIERVTDEAENRMFAVTESQVKKDLIPMRDAINDYFGRIEHLMVNQDQALGLPTGFRSLDTLLGGLQRSDLMIFAGRPGMGKCVAAGTLVNTENGMLPIEQLKPQGVTGIPDDEGGIYYPLEIKVQTPDGPQPTAYFYDSGIKPTLRLTTRAGYSLTGTYQHPILTLSATGEKVWKKLSELQAGDFVAVQRHEALWGKKSDLPEFEFEFYKSGFTNKPDLPSEMQEDLAYVLGLMIGDGNLTQKNYVSFSSADEEILAAFYGWATRLDLKPKQRNKYDHEIGSVVLNTWLKTIGVSGYAHQKQVPAIIMQAPENCIRAFLQGLFDTDGHAEVQSGYIQFVSTSEQLAHQVHVLLLNFGIVSRLSFKANNYRGAWYLRITGSAARLFYTRIGFRLKRKQERSELLPEKANSNLDVVPYLPSTKAKFPKKLNYSKYFRGNKSPGYQVLERIAEYATEVTALLEPQFYWDEITQIESSGDQHCYDLTVPDGHAFVTNGIVSHNTSFMLSVALNIARYDRRIAIFTMEMGVEQIVQRLVSMETGINMQRLRLGQVDNQEWSRLVEAMGRLSSLKIFIDDTPALTPLQMRTKCRRMAREHGIDLVIVDYLQLMNAGTLYENNRVQEISYISRSLKELARELNVPLFSAAQLSRAVEQRADKRPQLSDLRESGCLTGDSPVYLPDEGRYVPIADLCGKSGFNVLSLNTTTYKLEAAEVSNAFCTGVKPVYRLTTQLGRSIRATANHKFLTIHGWKRLDELTPDDHIALPSSEVSILEPSFATEIAYNSDSPLILKTEVVNPSVTGDVYWDKIASIVPNGEEAVYDLTVPQNSNFVVSNIIAHNSIEQDADIVMFLYRDEVYNEATEYPNQADVIVAKHRNGPTDTISLYFDKTITRFLDARAQSIDLSRG